VEHRRVRALTVIAAAAAFVFGTGAITLREPPDRDPGGAPVKDAPWQADINPDVGVQVATDAELLEPGEPGYAEQCPTDLDASRSGSPEDPFVVEGCLFRGVTLRGNGADYVEVRNNKFVGGATLLVNDTPDDSQHWRISQNTVDGGSVGVGAPPQCAAVWGSYAVVIRNELMRCVDGLKISNERTDNRNVVLLNHIHSLVAYRLAGESDGTHSDGIQMQGGAQGTTVVAANYIDMADSSPGDGWGTNGGVQIGDEKIWNPTACIGQVWIFWNVLGAQNYFANGKGGDKCPATIDPVTGDDLGPGEVVLSHNRLLPDFTSYGFLLSDSCEGNVWHRDGRAYGEDVFEDFGVETCF